jgi:UDP-N-acetyl-D-glucosamine/UDP-N-acetyl-D-galactosamine dehydrogenase
MRVGSDTGRTVKLIEEGICIVGLGYVGLPLAVAFAAKRKVVGYDKSTRRVQELSAGRDHTGETEASALADVRKNMQFTVNIEDARSCGVFIVTVPTPVDQHSNPDLTPLLSASEAVGRVLKKGDLVVYESTVYPGCTEEDCIPVIERASGLSLNVDFFCGYSPERVNPGDKEHTVTKTRKITSGSNPEAAERVDILYRSIIAAGTHRASSIKVAEAAKVIENSQRDVNIAFVNELALIFNRMGIDTLDVLEAAGTKWNFLHFKPGLVGGHCIGVDPYYLAHKAQSLGYLAQVILAGRRINDGMGFYIAERLVKLMIKKGNRVKGARVLLLGVTFKENCSDIRNSRAVDIVRELHDYGCAVDVFDPWADPEEVLAEYGIRSTQTLPATTAYDGLVLAVAHREFDGMNTRALISEDGSIYDVKGVLDRKDVDERL